MSSFDMLPNTECRFSSGFTSEGDGVKMLSYCVEHPEYRWYSENWPSPEEERLRMRMHNAELEKAKKDDG